MQSTFWMTAQETKDELKRRIIPAIDRQVGINILNRAWNHLWLDSEDTRPLGLELIELAQALRRVKAE